MFFFQNKIDPFPRKSNPFDFMRPVFVEARILGIRPLVGKKGWRRVQSYLTVFVITGLFVLSVYHSGQTGLGHSFLRIAQFFNSFFLFVFGMPMVFGFRRRRVHLKTVLENLETVGYIMTRRFQTRYEYNPRKITRDMIAWDVFKISLITLKLTTSEGFKFYSIVNHLLRCYFIFVADNVQRQFRALGQLLIGHFQELKALMKSTMKLKNPAPQVDAVCALHHDVVQCCGATGEYFGRQFFLIVSSYYATFMYDFCLILAALMEFEKEKTRLDDMAYYATWMLIRIYELWRMLRICSVIEDEAESFHVDLNMEMANHKINILDSSSGILEIYLAKKPDVKFWGSRFFPMDNSLLHSMAASLTTVYVIIIQHVRAYKSPQETEGV